MRQSIKFLAALPIVLGLAAPATSGEPREIKLTEREQAKLDARLAGRTAGKARSCINRIDQKEMTVISDDILIFGSRRNAKTIYINKPYGGCNGAKHNALVTVRPTAQLCSGEIIRVRDLTAGFDYGSCSFGKFVPYTKNQS